MTKGLNRFIKCFLGGFLTISVIFSCNDSPYMQGKRLYLANCANCHMEDGSGLSALIPSIQKSVYLRLKNTKKYQKKGEINVKNEKISYVSEIGSIVWSK